MSFELHDTVRIVKLLEPERAVDGSAPAPPQPRVGEVGAVVECIGRDLYLVENVTADGFTKWMAEFMGAELELVERPLPAG
ncbi:MAG TPA: hypothetical protein VJ596_09600 [Gemmatimonadaceae bacterium]|nr:hypothetical protein [Gemmatimonadaceae bacterium]